MNLRTPLVGVAGVVFLMGATALADPTYSIYSNPQLADGGSLRYGLNDSGSYVGWSYSGGRYFGFLTTSDGTTIAVDPPSATDGHATGINNSNVIVGYFSDASGVHGFTDAGGTYTTLNASGAVSTYAYAVNNKGQVVGYYVDKNGVTHGFIESGGSLTTLDAPGAVATYGLGVNDEGEVVGSFFDGSKVHGFIYRNGVYEVVDYPNASVTWLTGINEDDTLIGWSRSCETCSADAFVKLVNEPFSLPFVVAPPDYQLTGLNDRGQTLGGYGSEPAFAWDAQLGRGDVVASAPEPATATLLGAGALVFALARRLRKKR